MTLLSLIIMRLSVYHSVLFSKFNLEDFMKTGVMLPALNFIAEMTQGKILTKGQDFGLSQMIHPNSLTADQTQILLSSQTLGCNFKWL